MFSFDCRSQRERSLRLLHVRSSVQQRSQTEEKDQVGRKAAAHCLVCRWSASRFLANRSLRPKCNHCRHWNTTYRPAVDVAPRYHKLFSSHGDLLSVKHPNVRSVSDTLPSNARRALSCGTEGENASTPASSEETARGRTNPLSLLSSQSEPRGKEFRVRFSGANTRRERITLAKDARDMFHDLPFANPRPHDHRPVGGDSTTQYLSLRG